MKRVYFTFSFALIFIVLVILGSLLLNYKPCKSIKLDIYYKSTSIIKNIGNYNSFVKTNNETILYDSEFNEVGKINKNIELELDGVTINNETMYFKLKNIDNYVKSDSVEKIEKLSINHRYKRYVVFNLNAMTKDITTLYNDNGYAYQLNKSVDLPVIIKDTDKYYVEYNNDLYYLKKEDVTLRNNTNTTEKIRTNIRTFTYHAIYKDGEDCSNVIICHPYKQFDSHMKYLADNNYLTLTMEELEMFLDKKINIPIKTVVITLDDGNLAKNAIEVLEKYKLYATYFIITGKFDAYKIKSTYVKFESHTDNLHNNYKCPGGEQGGQLLCEKEEVILKDLKTSQEKLGGSHYLSYPFFDWNERAIKLLKQAGFRLAFIGQWNSEGYSDFNTNRMMIRRKTIFYNDSLDTFIGYLK